MTSMDPRDELAKALRDEAAGVPRPAPRKRERKLRKVSENCERVWVSPRCGGDFLQWKMKK
jgi:hypothetical protein